MISSSMPVICLAPLRGLTDAIFRNTYACFFSGVDWSVTPFLTTIQGSRIKPSHVKEVWPENNQHMPIVPQIIGKSAANFIALAKVLFDLGYETLNWNLGCPFPMVAKKRRGSGLLPYPDLVDAFLNETLAQIPNRLSIKMRLGRYRPDEIDALWPILNRYPLRQIIIHPRTGVQMYDGHPDEEAFARCLTKSDHAVIYNGDITTRAVFKRLQGRFPKVNTWMIGRGLLADPFLPARIKSVALSPENSIVRLRQFHDALYAQYAGVLCGPASLVNRMKGFWLYFSRWFQDGKRILKQIHKARRADQYKAVVERVLTEPACWQPGD